MDIKIGDKVRFLNSVGGGRVTSFKGKDSVWVEDEDGFDIPAYIRECVVVGEKDTFVRVGSRPQATPEPTRNDPKQKPAPQPAPDSYRPQETSEGERLNISLAFIPTNPKSLNDTRYEAYFINESNYYLFFNYMSRNNSSWVSRYNGTIEPNTKIFMEEFGKDVLNDLEQVCIQLVAYKKDKPFALKNPVSVELRLDTVKFYKLHSFRENDYFEEDALLYSIVRHDLAERELLISPSELKAAMYQKESGEKTPLKSSKKSTDINIVEVDLHIDELLDSTAGMSNADMLTYQLDKFHEVLKQYAGSKGQKIVFIHGKGDGVLRTAIEKELKTKYKQHYFQDASFREYGYGATMVTIK